MGMVLPLKTLATQELTVKRKLSENTLQASSPVTLGIRISIVALLVMELFTAVQRISVSKDVSMKFCWSEAAF
uniref:Uncharacterized protein n=1 Tax=Ailuropoda melanoleuca TaxID=9646 RepID=A0A7N5KNP0_AILME